VRWKAEKSKGWQYDKMEDMERKMLKERKQVKMLRSTGWL
jgi:hypothetical protein